MNQNTVAFASAKLTVGYGNGCFSHGNGMSEPPIGGAIRL